MVDPGVRKGSVLILGVGNVLMGDEGVGVHAVRMLDRSRLPADVELLDGGTGGFQLLSMFEEYGTIILIDATMDGRPAGTVTLLQPRFASEFPRSLSAHDIGLRDLLETAQLLGDMPTIYLYTMSIQPDQQLSLDLSSDTAAALPGLVQRVEDLAQSITAPA